jgi:hypothetical protein
VRYRGCHSCGVMESSAIPFHKRVALVYRDITYVINILYFDIWLSVNSFGPYVWNN